MFGLRKIAFSVMIATSFGLPRGRASAGVLIAVSGGGSAVPGLVGASLAVGGSIYAAIEQDFWFGAGLIVMGERADHIEQTISSFIPEAPSFTRYRIAKEFAAVAKKMRANGKGLKSLVLEDRVAAAILSDVFYIDQDTQAKLKRLMTVRLKI